jgi:hypothetical protein
VLWIWFFFVCVVLQIEHRSSCLLTKCSTNWATSQSCIYILDYQGCTFLTYFPS